MVKVTGKKNLTFKIVKKKKAEPKTKPKMKFIIKKKVEKPSVTVGTSLKFNPTSGLLDLSQYNNRGQNAIGEIIDNERRNLRKQLNRMIKKKGGKAFATKDAGRVKLPELQKRLMALGVSRGELEKIFKSYVRKAENKTDFYIQETEANARDDSEGVYYRNN